MVLSSGAGGNVQKLMHRKLHLIMRKNFYYEDIHTLEQMAQSGCGVSLNRDTQEMSGRNPMPHVL